MQGTVKDLRSAGLLDVIAHDSARDSEIVPENDAKVFAGQQKDTGGPTTKLVEEEQRATGDVKWSIYRTYLKASCVL